MNFLGLEAPGAAIDDYAVAGDEAVLTLKQRVSIRTVAIDASGPHSDHWVDVASLAGMPHSEAFEPRQDIVEEWHSPLRDTRLDPGLPESVLYGVGCSDSRARFQ